MILVTASRETPEPAAFPLQALSWALWHSKVPGFLTQVPVLWHQLTYILAGQSPSQSSAPAAGLPRAIRSANRKPHFQRPGVRCGAGCGSSPEQAKAGGPREGLPTACAARSTLRLCCSRRKDVTSLPFLVLLKVSLWGRGLLELQRQTRAVSSWEGRQPLPSVRDLRNRWLPSSLSEKTLGRTLSSSTGEAASGRARNPHSFA